MSTITNDIKRYSTQVADGIDQSIDRAASTVKDTLHNTSWIPRRFRPSPSAEISVVNQGPPPTLYEQAQDWVSKHRALAIAFAAFTLTSVAMLCGNKVLYSTKKRRARRAGNGARKEIVVIAGNAHEALVRATAFDLERKGFIVYIIVATPEEEAAVRSENSEDIRPLWIDLTATPPSPSEIHPSLNEIYSLITQPQSPMPGVPPHLCQLSGLILVPSFRYPSGPAAVVSAADYADIVNTRILTPILTTQLFLPLLTLKNSGSIVLLTPAIHPALGAPYASAEVTASWALRGFATSLRRELRLFKQPQTASVSGSPKRCIPVTELRLGNIDYSYLTRTHHHTHSHRHSHLATARRTGIGTSQSTGNEILGWTPQQRALYGPSYLASIGSYHWGVSGPGAVYRPGTGIRELHNAVFDAITTNREGSRGRGLYFGGRTETVYVGRGARMYGILGAVSPGWLVGWMFGLRAAWRLSVVNDMGGNESEGSRSVSPSEGTERNGGSVEWEQV